MKQMIYFLLLIFTLTGCGTINNNYETEPYRQLRVGMSKREVEYLIGPPERYLEMRRTPYGYQEILQYWTYYDQPFALEFINDYLTSANYIYGSIWYPMYPWENRPGYGRPIFPPSYRPDRPFYPPSQTQPGFPRPPATTRPPSTPRPPANTSRPESTTRPSESTPRPAATTRPSGSDSTNSSRQEGTQQNNSGRDSSRETRGN
ncbi:hypothetical protein AGMMS50262_13530 [Bacteroidia bacterium]|nr:hypothetical protein AGMMS50262_13530 [Bacteroidia bacterium]